MEESIIERRKFARAEFNCKITINSPGRMFITHTEDISAGGTKVILEERLASGREVSLNIYLKQDMSLQCRARVVWVVSKMNPLEQTPTVYVTGLQFTDLPLLQAEYIKKLVKVIISQRST